MEKNSVSAREFVFETRHTNSRWSELERLLAETCFKVSTQEALRNIAATGRLTRITLHL